MRRIGDILITAAVLIAVPWLAAHLLPPMWTPLAVLIIVGIAARNRFIVVPASRLLAPLREPADRQRAITTLLIWVLATLYFYLTARYQHRALIPRLHDEHCYLIQARMLAAGKLWQPEHPLADFFDNFYILARPVYAPIYFPGTALADAPFVKLGAPYWLMPMLAGGLVVGLTYNIATRLIDGSAGMVAAVCAITNWGLREFSTVVMAQVPLAALVLLAVYCWLRWNRKRQLRWEFAIGACLGWAAITRPVDAIAFAMPIGVAMMWLARQRGWGRNLLGLIVVSLAATPFVLLQASLDHGTTGSYFKTPYSAYLMADQPGSAYGFAKPDPNARPVSVLRQKQDYIDRYRSDEIRNHTVGNLPSELARRVFWTVVCTLPAGILAVLLPAAFFGSNRHWRWVFFAPAPLFVLLYLPNPFFLVHYTIPLVPITAFCLALAVHVLARGDGRASAYFSILVVAVCVSVTPECRPDIRDGTVPAMPLTAMLHEQLHAAVGDGAVVLIRYQAGDNPVEDPVYNDDVVWPDDAPVIRAHDLGPRDIEIARYYAKYQPSRRFFLLDRRENDGRATLLLHPLGTAAEFARSIKTPATE
jgi:hypothetical protein